MMQSDSRQHVQGHIAGGAGTKGTYGTLTQGSMQLIMDKLSRHCGLDSSSVFVDVGAGIAR